MPYCFKYFSKLSVRKVFPSLWINELIFILLTQASQNVVVRVSLTWTLRMYKIIYLAPRGNAASKAYIPRPVSIMWAATERPWNDSVSLDVCSSSSPIRSRRTQRASVYINFWTAAFSPPTRIGLSSLGSSNLRRTAHQLYLLLKIALLNELQCFLQKNPLLSLFESKLTM